MSHTHALGPYQHAHAFLGDQHQRNERRTWLVACNVRFGSGSLGLAALVVGLAS